MKKMCFKSGNYNPNVFIWISVGTIFFLLTFHYSIVSGNSPQNGKDCIIIEFPLQKRSQFDQYMGYWYSVANTSSNNEQDYLN